GGPRHSDISRAPWYMSPPWHAVVTRGCWCSPPSPSSSVWRRAAGRGSAAPRWPRRAGRSRPTPPRRSGISPRPKADRPLPRAEVRLGSVGAESGVIGAAMAPIAEGARAWVADVNARGGVDGHPVRLFQVDDGGDPGRSLAIVKRLVEQDHVQALYATHMPTT